MRFYNIAAEFCSRFLILADLGMLELGMCFYQGKMMHVEEAIKLLKEGIETHGQTA
jgi:hypothetical protein